MEARPAGERALLIEVEHPAATAAWLRRAADEPQVAVTEIVPAARTVLVVAPSIPELAGVRALVDAIPDTLDVLEPERSEPVEIAVTFDGPDLPAIAQRAGLDPDGVVRMLLEADLIARFCGFAPGFAYLGGVPEQLHGPRRAEPRTRVPAGSFALADEYAAIYPRESPGGWNLIGRSDAPVFDADRDPPALLVAGTQVQLTSAT